MTRTLVVDTPRQAVSLTTAGFESVEIERPSGAVEARLRPAFARPGSANARWFVSTLLAGCLAPHRSVRMIETLEQRERALLRRAVIDVCEEQASWRLLYGSHLSSDERLFAVMLWRQRRETRRVIERIREIAAANAERAGIAEASAGVASAQMRANLAESSFALGSQIQWALRSYDALTIHRSFAAPTAMGLQSGALATIHSKSLASVLPQLNAVNRVGRGLLGATGLERPVWVQVLENADVGVGFSAARPRMPDISRITQHYAALTAPMPSFTGIIEAVRGSLAIVSETWRGFEDVDLFIKQWESDALWLLFAGVDIGATRNLAGRSREQVEAIILDALEPICTSSRYAGALRQAVAKAPHLNSRHRRHLTHMLEHAEQHAYIDASAPLYFGLEGAYREAAYATGNIARPVGSKKAIGFEKLVRLMGLPAEVEMFVRRAVFGGTGNSVRHAGAEEIERRQVLLGIVALAAWIEVFAGEPALELLAEYLGATLRRAVKRVEAPALDAA
ncbi:MAG TPA: hypothetical protein VK680_07940 [Solirubrobacteraceae bacterium]|jgi:hypothetical protein|nr:hypothetical protein [Solirubrobacteraceae bacterium]